MAKLTLQEQLLKAGLVTSKKAAKVERTAKKSRVQAREARAAVEENKKAQLERDKQLSEQQKQAALAKEYKAQVKQLIEMNRITIANGDIGFNFTDGNLIKKIFVDKLTQAQLINGRLAIARLLVDNNSEGEYAIIPASVADKIAQRDASSIVLHSALSAEEQDEAQKDFFLLMVQSTGAAIALGEATAKAVQRIPDAHCNGDMHDALNYAANIKHKQKDFLTKQGIHALYD